MAISRNTDPSLSSKPTGPDVASLFLAGDVTDLQEAVDRIRPTEPPPNIPS